MKKPKIPPAVRRALAALLVACMTALSAYVDHLASQPEADDQAELVGLAT